jgi:energy-coupling factor transporter transmembrane protein EcfT
VVVPSSWLGAILVTQLVAAHWVLSRPARRGLVRFAAAALLVAGIFYGAGGPGASEVRLGPLGFSGADFETGLEAGARLAALLTFFALAARWLPARDLLPYATRAGLPAYLAGALLRTVPTIRADGERLREAQVARGHRFVAGPWGARSWLPFVVPLFVSVLRRAREQSIALHLVGLLPEGGAAPGRRAHRWAVVAALAALAVAGRLVLVAWPGVSLSFLVLFVAGVAYGPRVGLLVGLLERLSTDLLLSGLNPVFLTMAPVDAGLGALAGLAGRLLNFGQREGANASYAVALSAWAGAAMTLAFSVAADTINWLAVRSFLPGLDPGASTATWFAFVVRGLVFNVPSLVFNVALFAAAAYPTLLALRESGVLPLTRPARRPGATSPGRA